MHISSQRTSYHHIWMKLDFKDEVHIIWTISSAVFPSQFILIDRPINDSGETRLVLHAQKAYLNRWIKQGQTCAVSHVQSMTVQPPKSIESNSKFFFQHVKYFALDWILSLIVGKWLFALDKSTEAQMSWPKCPLIAQSQQSPILAVPRVRVGTFKVFLCKLGSLG